MLPNLTVNTPYYYYNGLGGKSKWENTDKFREAGLRWYDGYTKNKKGIYTNYPEGTYGYKEFWDAEEFKILNGLTIDGQYISGLHYFYLNYCPVYIKRENKFRLPDFWDLDADYFIQYEESIKNGQHMCSLKKRQAGFSFKNAVPHAYNLHFKRGSVNYIAASLDRYSTRTFNMARTYLNHINQFTDFYKNRLPDTSELIRHAYQRTIDGRKSEGGNLAELHKLTFKDNAEKGVGGYITEFTAEEGGVWVGLKDVIEFVKPAIEEGELVTGHITVYGSVGDLDKCEDLKLFFYNPVEYGFRPFKNIWSQGNTEKPCGYFIPEYICMYPHMDKDGNSDIEGAYDSLLKRRETNKKKDRRSSITFISQHPVTPEEAFLSKSDNIFPIDLLQKHLSRLENIEYLKHYGYGVNLHYDSGVVKVEVLEGNVDYFKEYPVEKDKTSSDYLKGNIWIYEPPGLEATHNLYLASTDSYDIEEAPTSPSLGVIYIYKKDPGKLKEYVKREIVASYIGRPELPSEFYDACMKLTEYYNAKNLVENANPGIINYHNNKNKEWLLQDEMSTIKGINTSSQVKRRKGYHPTKEVAAHGNKLILEYCMEVLGYEYKDDGTVSRTIYGLERIKDPGLIKELIAYNSEDNFDRLTAFRGCLLFEEAAFKVEAVEANDVNSPYAVAASMFKRKQKKLSSLDRI